MNRLKHTKNMEIKFCEKWPFRIELISNGKEIFSFDRIAHSTKQKTIEDCENAVGFSANERDNVIALLENQKADIRLFATAAEMLECMIIEVKIYAMSEGIQAAKQTKMCELIEKATGLSIEEVIK
jgi:hypothetical protein